MVDTYPIHDGPPEVSARNRLRWALLDCDPKAMQLYHNDATFTAVIDAMVLFTTTSIIPALVEDAKQRAIFMANQMQAILDTPLVSRQFLTDERNG